MIKRGYLSELHKNIRRQAWILRGKADHPVKVAEKEMEEILERIGDQKEVARQAMVDASRVYTIAFAALDDAESIRAKEIERLDTLLHDYETAVHAVDNSAPEEFKQSTSTIVLNLQQAVEKQDLVVNLVKKQYDIAYEMFLAAENVDISSEKIYFRM